MSLKVTYIGHATTLIEWDGLNILTDPLFSDRVLFFKRLRPLVFDPTNLPTLDAVLISHAHYDHLDLFSYKYIPSDVPIIIPEGMAKAISRFVNNPIIELATWSRYSLKEGVTICGVPAKHPGGRFLFPLRYRTCHGYVVSKGNENIYYSGDTAYQEDFENLKGLFDLRFVLLPIATNSNRHWIRQRHMNVDDAIRCWRALGKPDWMPIHWGTFFKTLNHPERIIQSLQAKLQQDPELAQKVHIVEPGFSFSLP